MSSAALEVAKLIVPSLLGAGGLVAVMLKRFPPRATTQSAQMAQLTERVSGAEKKATDCTADMRILTDYVHDLREHIATGKPPPPPDWPGGLRL